jgi:hypothetical protein
MTFFARNNTNSTLSAGNGPNLKVTLIKGGVEELAFDASMPQGPITVGKVLPGDNLSHIILAKYEDNRVAKKTCSVQYNDEKYTVTFTLMHVANGVNYPYWFKAGVKIDTSVEANRTFTICEDTVIEQQINGDTKVVYVITYPDFTEEFAPEEEVKQPEASPAKEVVDEPKATQAKGVLDEPKATPAKGVVDEPKATPAKGVVDEPKATPAQEDSDDENIVRKKKSDKRKIISDDEDEVAEPPEPSAADDKKLVDAVNKALERIKKEIKEHNTTIKNPDFKCMKQNHTIYFLLNKDAEKIADSTADEDEEINKKKFLQVLYQKLAEEYPKMAEKISKIRKENNAKYPRQKKSKA